MKYSASEDTLILSLPFILINLALFTRDLLGLGFLPNMRNTWISCLCFTHTLCRCMSTYHSSFTHTNACEKKPLSSVSLGPDYLFSTSCTSCFLLETWGSVLYIQINHKSITVCSQEYLLQISVHTSFMSVQISLSTHVNTLAYWICTACAEYANKLKNY